MKTVEGKKKFLELLTGLCELVDKEYSKTLLTMYYAALKGYSIKQVQMGIYKLMLSWRYNSIPKPIDIIESISGGANEIENTAQIQAGIVLNTIKKHGIYKSIKFSDEVTQAVILRGFGGWVDLCNDLKVENEKWFIKDFIKMYIAYRNKNICENGFMAGVHELKNKSNYNSPKILIEAKTNLIE